MKNKKKRNSLVIFEKSAKNLKDELTGMRKSYPYSYKSNGQTGPPEKKMPITRHPHLEEILDGKPG